MNAALLLRKKIDCDVFGYQTLMETLSSYSKPRDVTARLISSGALVRIRRGLYCFGEDFRRNPVSREYLANLVYGPSCISLDYALSYYSLIPEKVATVTSICPGRSRNFLTPFGNFTYRMLKHSRYFIGIRLEQIGAESFLIASPEKSLLDKIWTDRRVECMSIDSWEKYLEEDLRVDVEVLSSLSLAKVMMIAESYQSRKVSNFSEFFEGFQRRIR